MKPITIPVCDLRPHYQDVANEIQKTTAEVLSAGTYVLGPKVTAFEEAMGEKLGGWQCVGVGSGTDALELALRGLDLNPEDEVIIPAHSYPTVWGVLNSEVKPVLGDIDSETWEYDLHHLETIVTPKTKAIVVVHLYGLNMLSKKLLAWARNKNLIILEDCAQAFSGRDSSEAMIGTLGDIATFSFYPTKPLGAFGDGGMIATKDEVVEKRIRALRMYGETSRYNSTMIGTNSRLDELQAAYLLVKLPHVEKWRLERKAQAERYTEAFTKIPELGLPSSAHGTEGSYHLYPVRTKQRPQLQEFLLENGVGTAIHYPLSLSEVPSLQELFGTAKVPGAEKHSKEILSLPLFNGLSERDQETVIALVQKFFKQS